MSFLFILMIWAMWDILVVAIPLCTSANVKAHKHVHHAIVLLNGVRNRLFVSFPLVRIAVPIPTLHIWHIWQMLVLFHLENSK